MYILYIIVNPKFKTFLNFSKRGGYMQGGYIYSTYILSWLALTLSNETFGGVVEYDVVFFM